MAIWGWSYGGFVTASVLALDAEKDNIFKVNAKVTASVLVLDAEKDNIFKVNDGKPPACWSLTPRRTTFSR